MRRSRAGKLMADEEGMQNATEIAIIITCKFEKTLELIFSMSKFWRQDFPCRWYRAGEGEGVEYIDNRRVNLTRILRAVSIPSFPPPLPVAFIGVHFRDKYFENSTHFSPHSFILNQRTKIFFTAHSTLHDLEYTKYHSDINSFVYRYLGSELI